MATKISARNLNFFYGNHQALFDNNIDIEANSITAVIGPSGCGKSTHLRIYNRIFELYRDQRASGELLLDGVNILDKKVDVLDLRRRVGMIFQKPTPFPMSVFDNVAYPLRLHFKLSRAEIVDRAEYCDDTDKRKKHGANKQHRVYAFYAVFDIFSDRCKHEYLLS